MLPPATADLYRAGQRRVTETLTLARREWDKAGSPGRVDVDRLTLLVAASMVGAATDGAESVGAALAATGFDVDPVGRVEPRAFATSASDGRPLASLLAVPVVLARDAGMDGGRVVLDRIVHTQVQDATRSASAVAIAARPRVGWVRMVNPPCCSDCAVQAGRWFRHNQGFQRHPNCDCVHRPAHEEEPAEGYVESVDPELIHDLTDEERTALAEGADLSRLVNDRNRAPKMAAPTKVDRLLAGTDRDQALDLLRQNGYLTT